MLDLNGKVAVVSAEGWDDLVRSSTCARSESPVRYLSE